jgi:hypothetical protein
MSRILQRLALEPTAVGALLASVLPALVAFGVLQMDQQTIAVLVVAVNATIGFFLRTLVTPLAASPAPAEQAAPAQQAAPAPQAAPAEQPAPDGAPG